MLLSLKIENYALINSCKVQFYDGFSSITGETGAGKSIILGALGLILGNRADTQVLLDKERKCVVEATFSIDKSLRKLFDDNDLDFDTQSVFRREITPAGKSRAFINDTPVQLSIMKSFAEYLVDIHSQSATINLKNHDYQLSLIDSLIEDTNLKQSYKDKYRQYKDIDKLITDLQTQQTEYLKEKSFNEFLYDELEKANLQDGEQEEKENLLSLISNAQNIKENIVQTLQALDNEQDNCILSLLNDASNHLNKVCSHNETLSEISSRIESANIELKDIYNELVSFNNDLEFDPKQEEELSLRLDTIYNLENKHNVRSIAELLSIKDNLQQKLLQVQDISEEIDKQTRLKNQLILDLEHLSSLLHNKRVEVSEALCKQISPLLASMAMKEAVLKIEITSGDTFSPLGKDKVRFLFNANKTKENSLQDLSNVISGGELSRLMLALRAVVAEKYSVPTLIFDEIDTGISGDIASKTADIMLLIAKNHQVIAITHLVQMAAKAEHHYKVFKQVIDNQTQSNISLLDDNERINELAKMLSGDKITPEALANAKSLMEK